ncbi:MAG TPA: hypothetical protein VEI02_09275 [Planctomycetota bacterium]|nr:hypothetical protein [Planctomycetota bacterium]
MLKASLARRDGSTPDMGPTVRTWVRGLLGDAAFDRLAVTEIACPDPDCPPLETVLHFFGGAADDRRVRIPRPLRYLDRDDVVHALRPLLRGEPLPDVEGCC